MDQIIKQATVALEGAAMRYLILTAIVFYLVAAWWRNRKPASAKNVASVSELPIVGALPWLYRYRGRLLDGLLAESRAHDFSTLTVKWWGSPRYYATSDPAVVERVLREAFHKYPKGAAFHDNLVDLLGEGIFNSDGKAWQVQRKVASHLFSARSFSENIMQAFTAKAADFDAALAAAADSGNPVNMQQLFYAFTLDSIARIAFGVDLGTLRGQDVPFARAFDEAQAAAELRFMTPGWRLLGLLGLSPSERKIKASLKVLNSFCNELIAQRRATGDYADRTDVLSRFMAYRDDKTGEAPYLHDDKALRDVILNFMIAGRDTTAQALSWAVWLIAQHPEVEARIAAEVHTEITASTSTSTATATTTVATASGGGGGGGGWAPAYDEVLNHLRYTRSSVMETLRLYPSVPKDLKQASEEDVWPDGTVVPRGSFVLYMPWVMGRKPALWGGDAEEFRPDRFYAMDVRPSPFKFIAFNAGPRTCLGQTMATVEACYVLALVYSKYSLELLPGQDRIAYQDSLTLPQQRGVMMRVHRRGHHAGADASGNSHIAVASA